jgi:hypothetical protein
MLLLDRSQLLVPCRTTPSEAGDRFRVGAICSAI